MAAVRANGTAKRLNKESEVLIIGAGAITHSIDVCTVSKEKSPRCWGDEIQPDEKNTTRALCYAKINYSFPIHDALANILF